jgi:F-type H+-transporting ATPase subunit delta
VTNKTAATRYARALFDVALAERGDLDRIERDLGGFADLVSAHPPLERVLLNPAVPAPRKRAAVAELTSRAQLSTTVSKLLALLAERDRLILLRDLLASYRERLLDHRNVVRAEVTTAMPLEPVKAAAIERRLATMSGRTVALRTRVDPAILGGLVAKVGSTVYDGSVARQLERMKERL